MFDKVPQNLKWKMKDSVIQLGLKDIQNDLEKNLAGIVNITSIYMFMSGVYSTNPFKGIPYLLSKF